MPPFKTLKALSALLRRVRRRSTRNGSIARGGEGALSTPFKIVVASLATLARTGSPNNPRKRWSKASVLALISSRAAAYSSAFLWLSFLARRTRDCTRSRASYLSNIAVGRLICRRKAARAESELSKVFSCSNDLILSSRILIWAAAYDKINSPNQYDLKFQFTFHKQFPATRNTFHNGITQQYIASTRGTRKKRSRKNALPIPAPYRNSHATARCLTSCVRKYKTLLSPVVYAKQPRNNTFSSPLVPAKTVTQQRVAFTGGKRKTITQRYVAFTSGTRKNSYAITRYPH